MVLGLKEIMDQVGEILVMRMVGQESLELGGRDDRVLVLAQDVLNLSGQADVPLGVLFRARAQGRGNQLGGVAGSLGEFADLVKVLIWAVRLEVAPALLELPRGCRGKRG